MDYQPSRSLSMAGSVGMMPDGDGLTFRPWYPEPTLLLLALVRGQRWLAMLEFGEAKSVKEIALS